MRTLRRAAERRTIIAAVIVLALSALVQPRILDPTSRSPEIPSLNPPDNLASGTLAYATFLGGFSMEYGLGIAVDASGSAYVAGMTMSPDFPVTSGAFQTTYIGMGDAFVAKLSPDGSQVVWATFLGGSGSEGASAIALDSSNNVYVAGGTNSLDFPTTSGAFDQTPNGRTDAFVAKLSPDGSQLLWSTLLGGAGGEQARALAIGGSGNVYVTGFTGSPDFPVTPGAFDETCGTDGTCNWNGIVNKDDVFVTEISPDGHSLVWSTFLGAEDLDNPWSIVMDAAGFPVVAGLTSSAGFPATPGVLQSTYRGGTDAFIAKLGPDGSTLAWATFLGGSGSDAGFATLDAAGAIVISGGTDSLDFPVTPGAYQTTLGGDTDAFVGKLSSDGRTLIWATYLGGTGLDDCNAVSDGSGAIHVTGYTNSSDFPVTPDAFDRSYNGDLSYPGDAFVTKLALPALNRPPIISSFTATLAPEGMPVILTVNASDLDGDILTYYFDFDSDGTFDASGLSNTASHVWGDDYKGFATVSVSDGRLFTEANTTVVVYNVPPSIRPDVAAGVTGDLTLRVAGEKWHDVNLTIYWDSVAVANASVFRTPGSPDDQAATIEDFTINLLQGNLSAVVRYTPDDDPINGQPNGANPAWLIFTAKDGSESKIHHTFNVRHSDTWVWKVDNLRVLLAGTNITFTATATDPGSDDLTFTWNWGDGTPVITTTYFNDGIGPDPYPSPGGTFPFTAMDVQTHVYITAGAYSIVLRVSDDDGGVKEIMLAVVIPQ